jgi:hypothetical protein
LWFTLRMSAQPDDSTDTVSIETLRTENQALRVENQILKDEIARLKGLPLGGPQSRAGPQAWRPQPTHPGPSAARVGARPGAPSATAIA